MTQEELSVGSVVYVGRGSFRMEAIGLETEQALGVAQPLQSTLGLVTAPYNSDGSAVSVSNDNDGNRGNYGGDPSNYNYNYDYDDDGDHTAIMSSRTPAVSRTRTVGEWQAPGVSPLFGSQDNLPLLSAPTSVVAQARHMLRLSRVSIVALSVAVFVCGLLAAGAARSLTVSGPTSALAATTETPVAAPAVHAENVPVAATAEIHETIAPIVAAPVVTALVPVKIEVPATVKITARKTPAAHRTVAAPIAKADGAPTKDSAKDSTKDSAKTPAHKPWVDPFAD
jgi:hypothetical protein